MSKAYRDYTDYIETPITNVMMREHCKRKANYDKDGKVIYFTEQHHKKECDVNYIVQKYDRTGILTSMNKIEAKFGDMTGQDYKTMLDQVIEARNNFKELPSNIRKRFRNSPEALLEFMSDPGNRDEAITLGLIDKQWTEDTDGLGEHIKSDAERKVKTE